MHTDFDTPHPYRSRHAAAGHAGRVLRRIACCLAVAGAAAAAGTPQALAQATAGEPITDFQIRNLGQQQADIPFTFGQVFAAGQLGKNERLAARLPDGVLLPLQTDVKATHADGSLRHAILSGVLPRLARRGNETLQLVKAQAPAGAAAAATPRQLFDQGLDASVKLTIDGVVYRATLREALAGARVDAWLAGPVVREWRAAAPLRSAAGAAHPLLGASFAVRWYPQLEQQARVEVVVENTKTFQPGMRNIVYDAEIEVGGKPVFSRRDLLHYRHARWRHLAWWNPDRAPAIHLRHNGAYLIASKAVPNYDQRIVPAGAALEALRKQLGEKDSGPMTIGPVLPYMGATGGRADIGPLPAWSVMYLLSMDMRAQDAMLAAAEGSGSWSIHLRDERTGYPVRTDTPANARISTHPNLARKGPLPVPRCSDGDEKQCKTPFAHDTAHQPSLTYLPYLLGGDYYYLEELQFWAATNPLGTDPDNSGNGRGLVRWQQVRGQAWSLRTLGQVAYITPDTHPLKAYFVRQLDNNLVDYQALLVKANPNQLGAYDGSGEHVFKIKDSAPWQDDFLTWSFGYLAELGFDKALPVLRWKARYPVGRMTAPGYCPIQGAAYSLKIRDHDKAPVYTSFAQLYQANFGGDKVHIDDKMVSHPSGSRFIDQPCGSPAQADWVRTAVGYRWQQGRMSGYADSPMGFPANMQPALAVAAGSGIENAADAWRRFEERADKPDYSKAPQWAIIPR